MGKVIVYTINCDNDFSLPLMEALTSFTERLRQGAVADNEYEAGEKIMNLLLNGNQEWLLSVIQTLAQGEHMARQYRFNLEEKMIDTKDVMEVDDYIKPEVRFVYKSLEELYEEWGLSNDADTVIVYNTYNGIVVAYH